MPAGEAHVKISHSCDLKFRKEGSAVFRALTPSSLVDTDVSEKPATSFFKGMSRIAASDLLGPQICR